jgi:putative ABC transport system substrate-binding protein
MKIASLPLLRREFITLLGGAAAMTPINVYGQRVTKVPKIGVLWPTANETEEEPFIRSLRSGLQELGYVEGSTVILENRFASRQYDRFDALAAELLASSRSSHRSNAASRNCRAESDAAYSSCFCSCT